MVTIFIPDVAEFAPLRAGLERVAGCRVAPPRAGYWRATSEGEIVLSRKALGIAPALWYSALSGGFVGRIAEFGRDTLRITADDV